MFVAQYETEAQMTPTRHRSAWIWVAITAIALASMARAEAGLQSAKAYATPVFELLAASHGSPAMDDRAAPRQAQHRSARQASYLDAGVWMAMAPVLFVGLVAPLSLLSARSLLCLGRAPSAPVLTALFQRPPPLRIL
jgi:hypothetical protein